MSETSDYEDLRRYLLGQQPEEEADRLERRLLLDEDLFELAEAAEADLLDECARGELAPTLCEPLTRRLAASPGGRVRLARARGLAAALRRAQLAMLGEQRWAQPYFWAGFTLEGDWR